MSTIETLNEREIDEIIHLDRRAPMILREQRLQATDGQPPIAIERTCLPGGPTRPPVILVHGFAQNRYTWRISRRSLSGYLALRGYDVLNVELRGHGNSRAYGAGNASRFDQYVSDVCRVVDALDEVPFLMGHSLGAGVCIGVCTEREVRGLIHVAGVYSFGRFNRSMRALARVSRRVEPMLKAAPVRISTGWAGSLMGRLYKITDVAGYTMPFSGWAPDSIERDLLEERLKLGFDWTSVEVWLQMARWAGGERFAYAQAFEALHDLPLLVMAGDLDALMPPGDAKICYDASSSHDKEFVCFEPFEHQVHWGHLDILLGRKAPEEVWPRMRLWLDKRCP